MLDLLCRGLSAMGLSPSPLALDQLLLFAKRLQEQNQVMNLTAITDPPQIAELHFLDSAALLVHWDPSHRSLIDVGTGAGFPGLVLKILAPSLQLTLLDSLAKRIDWLRGLCLELGLSDVSCLHGRAEVLSHDPQFRDQFDAASSRAVASLPLLSELCLPFVKPGGVFLAMKSDHVQEELAAANHGISLLGGGPPSIASYALPLTGVPRCLLSIPKLSPTPPLFPRRWAKMQKGII